MKKLFTSLLICTLTICALSQSPEKMSYQAVIRNSSDQLVNNQKIGMRISILQGSVTGTAVYVETQIDTTNANGLLSIEIGGGTVESGRFDTIDWANGPYFIKTETDPTGGTSNTITGTSQLLSVPYALYAKTAGISRDAATKAYVDELESRVTALEKMLIDSGLYALSDADRNTYNIVFIGTQVWMAENLKTTKYNDGTAIPSVTDSTSWVKLTRPGYCWYDNDSTTYVQTYGALYNWHTVNTGKLCPTGWHVPGDDEWTTLTTYLGGQIVAGGKLKDTIHWDLPNYDATNEYRFTALPGGHRDFDGAFYGIDYSGKWWSATEFDTNGAWGREMYSSYSGVSVGNYSKHDGFSVRCVRDY